MSSFAIVIHFHILKDLSFCLVPSSEFVPVNQLDLERMKKALRHGIVPTITLAAHTTEKLFLCQYRLEIMTGILTAPVRMAYKPLGRITPQDRLPHGPCSQGVGNGFIHRQTDNSSRKQIEYRSHI